MRGAGDSSAAGAAVVALAAEVHRLLKDRGQTVGTAESLTGGSLAAALTAVPGASASYVGGVVSYATAVKEAVLRVPGALISAEGVISAACAEAMADGCRELLGSDFALATTGVAGPTEQEGRPVGTVYVGLASSARTVSVGLHLTGDRAVIVASTCVAALRLLAEALGDFPPSQGR
ncbi:MAG: CinA family protein, partial [Gordonia sp. (in: high G+C Gram-positive bacteria)]|uniref:CinA family protein n=1 Tax=Gordonia sp. (in: high G+C Gram-positive bacteria) TaxID=84139 RepID=UPI003BB69044